MKANGLLIASSKYCIVSAPSDKYNFAIKLMIRYLQKHPLFGPFDAVTEVISLSIMLKFVFSTYLPKEDLNQFRFLLGNDSISTFTKENLINVVELRTIVAS